MTRVQIWSSTTTLNKYHKNGNDQDKETTFNFALHKWHLFLIAKDSSVKTPNVSINSTQQMYSTKIILPRYDLGFFGMCVGMF